MLYNKNLILRYLYNLDNRDYPLSIKRFLMNKGSKINDDRESAINELYDLKGNCKDLAVLSKRFVEAMDKSYRKFTQYHQDVLEECDGENGVIRSPYFIEGSFVVYSIKNGSLTLWVFHDMPNDYNRKMAIPSLYIVASPKDKFKADKHEVDCMVMYLIDNCMEDNIRDYVDMVIDYLCLRQWAEVEIAETKTKIKQEIKEKKKTKVVNIDGITYFVFDSKWFTEICNNNDFLVSGHFRLQPYADGSKRLIWINEFVKHGYHRKALIDRAKEGEEFI